MGKKYARRVDQTERRIKKIYYLTLTVFTVLAIPIILTSPGSQESEIYKWFLAGLMLGAIAPAGRYSYVMYSVIAPDPDPRQTFRWLSSCLICLGSLGVTAIGIPLSFLVIILVLKLVVPSTLLLGYTVSIVGCLGNIELGQFLAKRK
jgi:hypothetical protein